MAFSFVIMTGGRANLH